MGKVEYEQWQCPNGHVTSSSPKRPTPLCCAFAPCSAKQLRAIGTGQKAANDRRKAEGKAVAAT